jgi:hypothetical protein
MVWIFRSCSNTFLFIPFIIVNVLFQVSLDNQLDQNCLCFLRSKRLTLSFHSWLLKIPVQFLLWFLWDFCYFLRSAGDSFRKAPAFKLKNFHHRFVLQTQNFCFFTQSTLECIALPLTSENHLTAPLLPLPWIFITNPPLNRSQKTHFNLIIVHSIPLQII